MTYRITKIICPHCEGLGGIVDHCRVCGDTARVSAADARAYADNLYTCAVGGYAVGDHDQKEKDRMTKKAMEVFRLLRQMPPWLRTAA